MMPSSSTSVDHQLIIHVMYGLDNFIIGKTKKRNRRQLADIERRIVERRVGVVE
jgi:hypothetical protein